MGLVKYIRTQKRNDRYFFQNSISSLDNSVDPDQLASLEAS